MGKARLETTLLSHGSPAHSNSHRRIWVFVAISTFTAVSFLLCWNRGVRWELREKKQGREGDVIAAEHGAVAADDARCSAIGATVLRDGGHAVDATVATALCLGVVNPMASGIGGGGFLIVRSPATSQSQAFDMRETAPAAAYQDMYQKNPVTKKVGPLSMGVPGELAGLHAAWLRHGRLAWKSLFQPSITLARDGFVVAPYFAAAIKRAGDGILADPGLRRVFAPSGKLLEAGDTCYNRKLSLTLQAISEHGPLAFYNGSIGELLVKDVREGGGILTMQDLRQYRVEVTEPVAVDVMGYTILGMPPPSSGTLGLGLETQSNSSRSRTEVKSTAQRLQLLDSSSFNSFISVVSPNTIKISLDGQVLNILASYGTMDAVKGSLGLHRLIESLKHMFSIRMNLGDPNFVNVTNTALDMLSPQFAAQIRKSIFDNTTFPPDYYLTKYSQLKDHGTSHFCIVDADRNAVSMTTTVNNNFGAMVLSPSTGIVLNNEMDDFSTPTETSLDLLPPAPSNFIQPNKKPLSSMTPILVLKDDQLAGVIGGSGGLYIIPAVIQVFLNNFILGMDPVTAVQHPRVYHKLVPNTVLYENWTVIDGEHIELSEETQAFLEQRRHQLKAQAYGATCQLVVHDLQNPIKMVGGGERRNDQVIYGMLTAVSDPRKDGFPAGF